MSRTRSETCTICGANDWTYPPSGSRRCRPCTKRKAGVRYRLPEVRARISENYKRWHRNNIEKALLRSARLRAAKKGLTFDLTLDDIVIPRFCPVLGIELRSGTGAQKATSPTLDRFDNNQGYLRHNVRVISWRANTLKNDATTEELEAVLRYMQTGGAQKLELVEA